MTDRDDPQPFRPDLHRRGVFVFSREPRKDEVTRMLEYTLVILIVGAAGLWLGRRLLRWMRGAGGGCGDSPSRPKRTTLTVGGRSVH